MVVRLRGGGREGGGGGREEDMVGLFTQNIQYTPRFTWCPPHPPPSPPTCRTKYQGCWCAYSPLSQGKVLGTAAIHYQPNTELAHE